MGISAIVTRKEALENRAKLTSEFDEEQEVIRHTLLLPSGAVFEVYEVEDRLQFDWNPHNRWFSEVLQWFHQGGMTVQIV